MRTGGFRFAVLLSLALAAAAVAVAATYHLPLRDPDGVAVPTYVRLPIILLLAFLTDVRARARVWRTRRSLLRAPRTLVAVIRERWPLGARAVRAGRAGCVVPHLRRVPEPQELRAVRQPPAVRPARSSTSTASCGSGHDPATVLHHVFGVGWAAQFFSFVYVAWIVFVPVSLVVALVWSRDRTRGAWYVTAVAVDWVLGVATYFAVPTLGPVYAQPQDFVALPHTYVSTLQETMIQDRYTVLFDPFATHAVQTIAAFASLHVGIMVTVCLMTELLGMKRWVRVAMWVFLVLTVLATVYLGWHYFVDTLGGAVLGAAGVWIAALGTGNHDRGWPRLQGPGGRAGRRASVGLRPAQVEVAQRLGAGCVERLQVARSGTPPPRPAARWAGRGGSRPRARAGPGRAGAASRRPAAPGRARARRSAAAHPAAARAGPRRSAASTSGTVQSVKVDRALSCEASGRASRWASSPARRTSTGPAAMRGPARPHATSFGSTASTDETAAG